MPALAPPLVVRCPRCARKCEPFNTPMPGQWFVCGNCERGDALDSYREVDVAMGPYTFTLEEANEAQRERRLALSAWDLAAVAFWTSQIPGYPGAVTRAFVLGCDWMAAAHEAGLGRVDRPAATAWPAEQVAA